MTLIKKTFSSSSSSTVKNKAVAVVRPHGGATSMRSSSQSNHFPSRLHAMLDEAEAQGHQGIVSWNMDGNSFTLHQSGQALIPIIGRYFRQTKYKSFLRQLQGYAFTRITRGELKGRCSHPQLQRGLRSKSLLMKRKPAASVAARTGEASTTGMAPPPTTTTLAPTAEKKKPRKKKITKGDKPVVTKKKKKKQQPTSAGAAAVAAAAFPQVGQGGDPSLLPPPHGQQQQQQHEVQQQHSLLNFPDAMVSALAMMVPTTSVPLLGSGSGSTHTSTSSMGSIPTMHNMNNMDIHGYAQ